MNNKKRPEEDEDVSLSDALAFLVYHTGVFAFKITLILVLWVGAVHYLEKWLVK
jgi:hypothetical protein